MNKNVVNLNEKLVKAVVVPYMGVGEDKVILHEVTLMNDGTYAYGGGNTWTIDPAAVLREDRPQFNAFAEALEQESK